MIEPFTFFHCFILQHWNKKGSSLISIHIWSKRQENRLLWQKWNRLSNCFYCGIHTTFYIIWDNWWRWYGTLFSCRCSKIFLSFQTVPRCPTTLLFLSSHTVSSFSFFFPFHTFADLTVGWHFSSWIEEKLHTCF